MAQGLKVLEVRAKNDIAKTKTLKELDGVFRVYLGRKGEVAKALQALVKLEKAKRAKTGKALNALKTNLETIFQAQKNLLEKQEFKMQEEGDWLDITAPGVKITKGHLNPLTLVQRQANDIFRSLGFAVAQGPEVENEWYNFDALNIPASHPARDMWDTFWIKQKGGIKNARQRLLLRTHTSPVQVRHMEQHNPPLRIIVPGRVFRYEATDARHQINFYQLEGLMVDKKVSVANFRAMIQQFYRKFFGFPTTVRLRPSYFPFTEPSFEVDMTCVVCKGKGCSSCGHSGWMEMMGAGMVHPNVFRAAGYNPKNWQGFAFGMGLDRLAMMKYKVDDIRLFYSGDLKFLQQF